MRTKPTLVATTGSNFYGVFRNSGVNNFSSLSLDGYEHTNGALLKNVSASGTAGDSGFLVSRNAGSALALSSEL
jgi:hypothetical protein